MAVLDQNRTIVLVGHGSREPRGSAEFIEWVRTYQSLRPDLDIHHGFVELAEPHIKTVLESLARAGRDLIIIPVSLFAAGHVKNELPLIVGQIQAQFPMVQVSLTSPLGIHPLMVSAVTTPVEALWAGLSPEERSDSLVIMVGRGSSDPDANGDFFKMSRLIAEGLGGPRLLPCFMGITSPKLDATLQVATRLRPRQLVVAPYLLFAGVLLGRLHETVQAFAAKHPWTTVRVAEPLARATQLYALLDERIAGAFGKADPLPCTTCQYRVPIGAIAGKVGGLDALLWSVRHSYTHTQAAPHTHAHAAFKKHVLVCTNTECAGKGSIAVMERLRRELRAQGLDRTIKVTRTSCMGRCGEGPTVVVYPDGIWYRSVEGTDVSDLITEHLIAGRLLARRVDNIM